MHNPNLLVKIWHFLTLKNYHNNLLTFNSAVYLFIISLVMIMAALMEAFAWGYLASSFTPYNPLIGWSVIGVFVFILMWTLDRSMASADLLKNQHQVILNGYEIEEHIGIKQKIWIWIKDHFSFIIRLGVVCLSLYITAPFLTQVVFRQDIENKQIERYMSQIEAVKQERQQKHDNQLAKQDDKITTLENDIKAINEKLQQEISGKSGTGYGDGPVAASIKRELLSSENQLKTAHQEKQKLLEDFKLVVKSFFILSIPMMVKI